MSAGTFVGRVWTPEVQGPSIVLVTNGAVFEITSRDTPTMRDLLELDDVVDFVRRRRWPALCSLEDLNSGSTDYRLLAPNDLQAIKACGVTFARSMIERVIEERASGSPVEADRIRTHVTNIIGGSLATLRAGSEAAAAVKKQLVSEGLWSQYLEVGIGPDAEVFTKSQPMSAVGHGADCGLPPSSDWNNPEPEIVLAVDSVGRIKGAALGNDVNLRDIEGRSALLLGKAKDNNASCAIGPFIRLFDETYGIDNVRRAEVELRVEGVDGFVLCGRSSMAEISRDPVDLVTQTIGLNHQYPDGLMLFLGTMFSPIEDRDAAGQGFTHHIGDRVTVSNPELGELTNVMKRTPDCSPWTFGVAQLMRNLASRSLL